MYIIGNYICNKTNYIWGFWEYYWFDQFELFPMRRNRMLRDEMRSLVLVDLDHHAVVGRFDTVRQLR